MSPFLPQRSQRRRYSYLGCKITSICFTDQLSSSMYHHTGTLACPPSLPSVTNFTCHTLLQSKGFNCSTIVLIVFFIRSISPFTSTSIFLDKSPLATAVVTSAIFLSCYVGWKPFYFTESVKSFQRPSTRHICLTSSLPSDLLHTCTRNTRNQMNSTGPPSCWRILHSRISPLLTVIFLEGHPLHRSLLRRCTYLRCKFDPIWLRSL